MSCVAQGVVRQRSLQIKMSYHFLVYLFLRITYQVKWKYEVNIQQILFRLINYSQIQKYISMTLLRKYTLSLREASPLVKTKKLRGKAFSQDNLFPFVQHKYCKKQRRVEDTRRNKKSNNTANERAFGEHEVKKITGKNALTVNFDNSINPNALPSITTFDNMKDMLIKQSLFDRFKECCKKNGNYQSGLQQLTKEDSLQPANQNINTQFKLPSHRHLQQKIGKSYTVIYSEHQGSKQTLLKKNNHRFSYNVRSQALQVVNLPKSMPNKGLRKEHFKEDREVSLQNRIKMLEKLQNITNACKLVEQSQVEKSINLFSRFAQRMDGQLLRKKKKLQKLYYLRV